MPKFTKKPVTIEAVQYGPYSAPSFELLEHLGTANFRISEDEGLIIETLEGDMRADIGDWIIKGVKGEFYPCKPDIFAATYETALGA